MTEVGLREMRQNARELVRRAEAGERLTVSLRTRWSSEPRHPGHQRLAPRARALDLLIAATAHAHEATLYTRNPADLAGLETLLDVVAV